VLIKEKEVVILPIGQKVFQIEWKSMGMTVKAVGPEGMTMEMTANGELTGFGPAQGLKGMAVVTFQDIVGPGGITTGSGQGFMSFAGGETAVWKFMFAGRMKSPGVQAWMGPVTYMTMSEKLAWMNKTVFITEGEGKSGSPEARDTVYEWVP
jgi:hypothetical protein